MELNGMLDNGKSETSSPHLTGTPFIHPIEPLKKSGKLLLLNPTAIIFKTDST